MMGLSRKTLASFLLAAAIVRSIVQLKSKEAFAKQGPNISSFNKIVTTKGEYDVIAHNTTTSINVTSNSSEFSSREKIRREQIRNYREGKALIINVHITHHGGTTFCGIMRNYGPTPTFACNGGDNWNFGIPNNRKARPWTFNQTSEYIPIVRKHFHMIGWEFGFKPKRPLSVTDWENPLLVSVLIVKHPIDRIFAGSANTIKKYGKWDVRTQSSWWEIAQTPRMDNFALDKLSPKPCPSGENTSLSCLEAAKDVVKRFTYILDIACLDDGMIALTKELGLPPPEAKPHNIHPSAAERLGNATLHEWLIRRNRRDIELYQWARNRALVNCSDRP